MQNNNQFQLTYQASDSIRVVALYLQTTGTYNEMYNRPYVSNTSPSVINELQDRLVNNGGGVITPELLSGLSNQIITPSAVPLGTIHIPNGWNETRMLFILELEILKLGITTIMYIQGYTDYMGVSLQGTLDEEMYFYINSYTSVRRDYLNTPTGERYTDTIIETGHLIGGKLVSDMGGVNAQLMRPFDVMSGIEIAYTTNHIYNDTHVVNTATMVTPNMGMSANKAYNLPSNYLASLLQEYKLGDLSSGNNNDNIGAISYSKSTLGERPIQENSFIRFISIETGNPSSTYFQLKHLQVLEPYLSQKTTANFIGTAHRGDLHTAGSSEFWNGSDIITDIANKIMVGTSSLISERLLTFLSFTASNRTIGGDPLVTIISGKSLCNINLINQYEMFKYKFIRSLMNDLSHGNSIAYTLTMEVNLLNESRLRLQWDSYPPIDYVLPNFADNAIIPTFTQSMDVYDNLVSDAEQLLNVVKHVNDYGNNGGWN